MSIGNPKKFELTKKLVESDILDKTEQSSKEEVTRVYRTKNSRVKKALRFETKGNKPKLT